ncbi:cobalt ABC transporter, ATPase subunit [Alkaliphilus metalliredigens QYMF]|uniref:ABC transporter ATP-binding protein n=1 Tax=Alkaliphilus metalliredigens (strain QYMF) TaxID=293826 RepID=A6TKN4_ALKMQ|nr:ATP-binding cassette domain-containing protein [Alkaliphilus metalliredigens]ABR46752.1 cobalt ABC transporter, ATPase subunit [Alkaliphilus metalliredigens QYMF]
MKAIMIEGLRYNYPDGTLAIDNISLTIEKQKKIAFLGANGSGKSTLLHHLNGLIIPQEGSIKIMGNVINKKNIREIRKAVGMVFDNPEDQLFSTTVYDDVAFGPRNLGYDEDAVHDCVNKALSLVGAKELQQRPPYNLSLGQKKKVSIAGILAMNPEIMVLDEPFSGLDPYSLEQLLCILERLYKEGNTLIISTHDVDLAYSWADECVILRDGKLLAHGSTQLLEDKSLMEKAKLQVPNLYSIFKDTPLRPKNSEEGRALLGKLLEKQSR